MIGMYCSISGPYYCSDIKNVTSPYTTINRILTFPRFSSKSLKVSSHTHFITPQGSRVCISCFYTMPAMEPPWWMNRNHLDPWIFAPFCQIIFRLLIHTQFLYHHKIQRFCISCLQTVPAMEPLWWMNRNYSLDHHFVPCINQYKNNCVLVVRGASMMLQSHIQQLLLVFIAAVHTFRMCGPKSTHSCSDTNIKHWKRGWIYLKFPMQCVVCVDGPEIQVHQK